MAAASGLGLVSDKSKNPLKTTTYGTGELICQALDDGAKEIILGIGGSATNDAGTGMAQALGVAFRDGAGRVIRQNGSGAMLRKIEGIDMRGVHLRLARARIQVASDVDNPLCGRRGAAYVFAPQKGATPAMVKTLDANLRHFAKVVKRELGADVVSVPGAGAAGGLGAGLVVFAGAELKSGFGIVSQAASLEKRLRSADLIFTGEGRVDFQTAFGKTPAGVAKLAGKHGVPVIAIGGGLADDARENFAHGIDGLEPAVARDMPLREALFNAEDYIANAAERALRLALIGQGMERKERERGKG